MDISPEQAIALLKKGEVVSLPTETVYGLAACIDQHKAISKIFTLKGRPQDNPLIIHISSLDQLDVFHPILPPTFDALTSAFWPGLLTIVLPIDPSTVAPMIRADLPTVAFRMPAHPLTRQIITETGPLVMPSANLSGKPSATTRAHVEADFGQSLPVLDGGACEAGIESTIAIYRDNGWQIIREGALALERISEVVVVKFREDTFKEQPICPGQKYRHYAPRTKLTPTVSIPEDYDGAIVGYSDRTYPSQAKMFLLGKSTDEHELGTNLYAVLRSLDESKVNEAVVDLDLPATGLFHTLRERLLKASSAN